MYRDRVRQCLRRLSGYECQEGEGEFMLAFHSLLAALQFCLQVCYLSSCTYPLPEQRVPRQMEGPVHGLQGCYTC